MSALVSRKIVLCVSGGIAAYKAADLASRLRKAGAEVRVAMTSAAREFVAPLTFEAIAGHPVYESVLARAESYRMEHIEWARWADAVVVAPATADFMAKMAAGIADDAPLTLYLAFRGPVWIAPAMNTAMWEHPATQANLKTLESRGAKIVGPGAGPLACGEVGEGRMAEPAEIVVALGEGLGSAAGSAGAAPQPLAGKTVLITAGPTREPLDPIRFVSNRSTGKMGTALAASARRLGARVLLIHGPLEAAIPPGVESIPAESSLEMLEAVQKRLADCQVAIFAAAVANYRPASRSNQKLKGGDRLSLEMIRNPDIAGWAGANRKDGQLLVGFCAESEKLIEAAKGKLRDKKLDLIFANWIGVPGVGFVSPENEVTLIDKDGRETGSGKASKERVADWMWEQLLPHLDHQGSGRK